MPGFRSIKNTVPWRDLLIPLAVWLIAVAAAGTALAAGEAAARGGVRERQDLRTHLGATFLATQARDVITREQGIARQYLTGSQVTHQDFTRAAEALGFPAAVLVNGTGRLMQVAPAAPDRLGVDMTTYPHIREALTTGRPAVSPVVPSAARGVPVVGFAVPFASPTGRRVFSGALAVQSSPLGEYLQTAVALPGSRQYLVDSADRIAAAGDPSWLGAGTLEAAEPGLPAAVHTGAESVDLQGKPAQLSSATVRGTSWTLVVVTPDTVLYAVDRSHRLTRPAFAIMAVLGLLAALLVGRARGARRALAEANTRFGSVFHSSLLGMALSAPDGRLLAVNEAFCRMLGHTASTVKSMNVTTLMHPDDRSAAEQELRQVMAGAASGCSFGERYVRSDGSTVHVVQTCTVLRDANQGPMYIAVQILDVSERRELEQAREAATAELTARTEQLEVTNSELARAHRSVSDLVAMLSHDLRQPLTTVIGYADLALSTWDEADPADKLRYLTRIKAGSHRAHALLDETLTLSALDGAKLVTTPTAVGVDEAVADALSALEGTLPHVEVTALGNSRVRVDRSHLNQVLINLLSNAAKYGAAPLAVSCDQVDDDTVAIHVVDSGPGVAPEFVPQLFDRFSRSDAARHGPQQGTGLGLYIVRSLLAANGGDVQYGRPPGGGSRFTVLLPVATESDTGQPSRTAPSSVADPSASRPRARPALPPR